MATTDITGPICDPNVIYSQISHTAYGKMSTVLHNSETATDVNQRTISAVIMTINTMHPLMSFYVSYSLISDGSDLWQFNRIKK